MKKQSSDNPSQAHAISAEHTSLFEDTLTLQEGDFSNALVFQYLESFKKKPTPITLDENIKRRISSSIWPRLLVIRIRKVLVAIIPIITLLQHPYFMDGLNYLNLILGVLGWILHALRLLINLVNLLMQGLGLKAIEKKQGWQARLLSELSRSWIELGNDLLWIATTLLTSSYIAVSLGLLLIEVLWVLYCGFDELHQLKQYDHVFEKFLGNEFLSPEELVEMTACKDNLRQRLVYTQKKLILSLFTTLSAALLFVLRFAIIPALWPVLEMNPIISLIFTLLSLLITLASHFIGKWLKNQKPSETVVLLDKSSQISATSRFTFFKPQNVSLTTIDKQISSNLITSNQITTI